MKLGHSGGGRFSVLSDMHNWVIYVVQLDYWRPHEHVIGEDWEFEQKQKVGEHIDLLHRQLPEDD